MSLNSIYHGVNRPFTTMTVITTSFKCLFANNILGCIEPGKQHAIMIYRLLDVIFPNQGVPNCSHYLLVPSSGMASTLNSKGFTHIMKVYFIIIIIGC